MNLKLQHADLSRYLEPCEIIDFADSREILGLAQDLATHAKDDVAFIKAAYEYVRDRIHHSADIQGEVVTCKASDVLREGQGICYAKAHLLAAILRANRIPAGLCYQKLVLNDCSAPYLTLHGLNAVYIESMQKWIRLDARGNKPGVDAQFSLEAEQLAFPVRAEMGETDIPIIFAKPVDSVVDALSRCKTLDQLWDNLPTRIFSRNTERLQP